jgi:hypothetical protein
MAPAASQAHNSRSATISTVTLTPAFKLVFLSVLGLTILSMMIACPIAILLPPSQHPQNLQLNIVFETCITTFKLGFGAMIGLLGGKAL